MSVTSISTSVFSSPAAASSSNVPLTSNLPVVGLGVTPKLLLPPAELPVRVAGNATTVSTLIVEQPPIV